MKTTRQMLALAAMMSLGSIVPIGAEEDFPPSWPDPPCARKRTSGNTPVSGGGARERERRLRKMSKQQS